MLSDLHKQSLIFNQYIKNDFALIWIEIKTWFKAKELYY